MADKITIEEVKKAKVKLEADILKMLNEFEQKYNTKLGYIDTMRERPKSTIDGYHPSQCMPEEQFDDKPFANVEIDLRIE